MRAVAALTLAIPCLPVAGVAAVLLVVAETWAGRALGLGFLVGGVSLAGLPVWRTGPGLAVAAGLLAGAWLAAPPLPGPLADGPGLQAVWLGPAAPRRWSLPWVTPERDQMALAASLVWIVDPLLDRRESRGFARAISRIHDEMDAGGPPVASALGLAYGELLGGDARSGHVWVDLAPGPDPQGAIVFLHGFGGNAQAYPWALRTAAHARGYAIVAPSFGAGFWFEAGGRGTVEATLAWMRGTGRFDMDRVALAGLSNGAYGVEAAADAHPWAGLAWLSAVVDADRVARSPAVPTLVLHGARDDRVPPSGPLAAADALRARGVPVDLDVVGDADHFLLFTHRDRVDRAVDRWLDAVDAVDAAR